MPFFLCILFTIGLTFCLTNIILCILFTIGLTFCLTISFLFSILIEINQSGKRILCVFFSYCCARLTRGATANNLIGL